MFLERFFELPVCTRLSDTEPLTYPVWDMLVDLNLYVQTINHRPYEFSRQHRFNAVLDKPQCSRKKQNSATRTEDSTSVRAQNLLHNLPL